jgi:hypothetical protein
MRCMDRRAREALEQLLLGGLSASSYAWLRAHAKECASCHEEYDRISRVAIALEKPAAILPQERLKLLEAQLLGSLKPTPLERRWRWALPVAVAASAAALLVVTVPGVWPRGAPEPFQARGTERSIFGVRAFCVQPGSPPQVIAEARPHEALRCPLGAALQFTYTAPRASLLEITSVPEDAQRFFPSSDARAEVTPGVDVPLPYSTPVTPAWLREPTRIVARFREPGTGAPLAETFITVRP